MENDKKRIKLKLTITTGWSVPSDWNEEEIETYFQSFCTVNLIDRLALYTPTPKTNDGEIAPCYLCKRSTIEVIKSKRYYKELTTNQKGITMTDLQPSNDLNSFPEATLAELTAQVESVLNLYRQFTDAVKTIKTQEIYKIRGLGHLDDGWLWIKEGLGQAQLNAQSKEKPKQAPTPSGSEGDSATTSGSNNTAQPENTPAA